MSNTKYIFFTRLMLLFVFLVILAGGIVRTTQSGMGCPDWPHCFGRIVPPLSAGDLPADYKTYLDKQDIDAIYNPLHAWIEYINRLLTGVLGILMLAHVVWSYKKFFKSNRKIFWLSFGFVVITILEAWLGKIVVDTNLSVVKITAHMLLALALAAIPVIILFLLGGSKKHADTSLKIITVAGIMIVFLQILIGTEVREQIDVISKNYAYQNRSLWLAGLNYFFDIHRILAFATALCCIFIFLKSLSHNMLGRYGVAIFIVACLNIAIGLLMNFFNIPAFAQPIHLLLSSILFILLFAVNLRLKKQ